MILHTPKPDAVPLSLGDLTIDQPALDAAAAEFRVAYPEIAVGYPDGANDERPSSSFISASLT